MTHAEITTYAETMMEHYGLEGWTFEFIKTRRVIGRCNHKRQVIQLSALWADGSEANIKDTILHEIAHALTRGHGHDKVWKAMCVKIGAKPERCATTKDSPSVKPRYVAVDNKGAIVARYFRKPNARTCQALADRKMWYKVDNQKVFATIVAYEEQA